MSTERERSALKLFEAALALPAQQRANWLEDTCGDDQRLANEVRSLLSAHDDAADFLESGLTHITPSGEIDHLAAGDLALGRQLGDFLVEKQIGAGGMGLVYRATQVSLNRPVALKVLPPYLRHSTSARTRFSREIEAAARLQHRNIVAVYTTGEELGAAYYAMELIEGPALSELIAALRLDPLPELKSVRLLEPAQPRKDATTLHAAGAATPLPSKPSSAVDLSPLQSDVGYFRTVARLLADVAEGLDYAHAQNVVHRDVKPSNLLFSADGEIHLSDFGLARIAEQPGLTRTGEVLGTPYYMAPEQVAAGVGDVDGRTDVYALGATLYELLTLRPPFVGDSRDQVTSQIAVAAASAPRTLNRQVPVDLETICLKALEKQPSHRYANAQTMAYDLRNFAAGRAIDTRPSGLVARGLRWMHRYRAAATVLIGMSALIVAVLFFAYRTHLSETRWTDAEFDRVFETAQFAALEGDLTRAGAAIDQAERLGASAAQLNLLRGQLALKSGIYQDACDQLELAVNEMPRSVAAHALLSQAYDANEQDDKTTEVLRHLEQLQPVTLQDYLLLGQARLYNDFDAGLDMLNEAVNRDKTNIVARLVRGSALVRQAKVSGVPQHAESALDDLRIASELLEPNAFLLGRTLEAQLIAASAYRLSGDEERHQSNLDQAAAAAKALTSFSDNYRAHRWRAFYFDYIGDDEQALESWRAMQQTRIAYLVIALLRLGEFEEALQLCDNRLERYPGGRFTEFFRALILSTRTDDPREVQQAFVRSPDEETFDLRNAHRFHYCIFCLSGRLDEAQKYCRLLRDSGKNFDVRDAWQVDLLQYTCGEIDTAALLEHASGSQLALIEANFVIGMTHLASGNRATARRHFAAATEFNAITMLEGPMSRALLAQLDRAPSWPTWIADDL
ncbi:MAG: protein kinase domain-containing protein [Bythopirellula sp.]